MGLAQYVVVNDEGEWKISHERKLYGPYRTQWDAVRAAIDTAYKAGQQGHDAEVLVQGANNQFRTEFTYRHAPYPQED